MPVPNTEVFTRQINRQTDRQTDRTILVLFSRTGYWLRSYIPLDTNQIISEMLFLANLLTSTEKTKPKPREQPQKVQ